MLDLKARIRIVNGILHDGSDDPTTVRQDESKE